MVGLSSISGVLLGIPMTANAQALPAVLTLANLVGGNSLYEVLIKLLTQIGNLVLAVSAIYVKICAIILNIAVNLTMNISWFVNNNQAIETTWITIRDFSSIFFIGMLIYASICLIIGIGGPGIKSTIYKVVVAALLVNFSLFITKTLIDVSNVLTLSIYSSIAPGEVVKLSANNTLVRQQSMLSDNGLSNVLMGLLKLQTIYDPSSSIGPSALSTLANRGSIAFRVIVATIMGAAIMVIAGTNFFVVSLVFISRFAILILLLIFSPIAFLGNIIPMLGKYSAQWRTELYNQLLFPPLYFIILYVALKIMTEPRFQNIMGGSSKTGTFASAFLDGSSAGIGVIIQYGIVIYLMTQALVIAKQTSGTASQITDKHIKKYGGMVTGAVLASTVGLGASTLRKSDTYKKFLGNRNPSVGMFIDSKVKQVATKAKFGSGSSYQDRLNEHKTKVLDYSKSLVLGKGAEADALKEYNKDIQTIKKNKEDIEKEIANINSREDVENKRKTAEAADVNVAQIRNKIEDEAVSGRYDPALDSQLAAAQTAQANAKKDLEDTSKKIHKELSDRLTDLNEQLSKIDNADTKKRIIGDSKKKLQRELVNKLKDSNIFKGKSKFAAEALESDLGKDESQRNLDTIKKLLEDAGKSKS